MNKRYVVKEAKGGKLRRFYIWDTQLNQLKRGQMEKYHAIGLEGILNNTPHKEK